TIMFQAAGAGNSQQVTVNLTILPQVLLSVNPEALSFTGMSGGVITPRSISITSSGMNVTWTATATTKLGGNWLSVSPTSSTTPGSVTITASPAGLAP